MTVQAWLATAAQSFLKEFATERSSPLTTTLIPDRLPHFVRQSLQPVDEIIEWGRHRKHRVTWRDGSFEFPQHEDLELERALEVLGADPCPCLKLAHLLIHGPEDPLALWVLSQRKAVQTEGVLLMRSRLLQRASQDKSETLTRHDYLFAFALPAPLRLRVGLAVVASYSDRWEDSRVRDNARSAFQTFYGERVNHLLEQLWPDKPGPARVKVLDPGMPAAAEVLPPGDIELSVPVTWAYAWAVLPSIGNDLVLDLTDSTEPDRLQATVVSYENGKLGPVRQLAIDEADG